MTAKKQIMSFEKSPSPARRCSKKRRLLILFILLLMAFPASANTPSVYLMDNEGRIIHAWEIENTVAVLEAHLRDNGNLVVVAGPRISPPDEFINVGSIREYTWDNAFIQKYHFDGVQTQQHHAIDILPNGNILAIGWKTRSLDEAIEMGLRPQALASSSDVRSDIIAEIDRSKSELVWRWDIWDHLAQDLDADLPNYGQIDQHPQRIDINYQPRLIGDLSRPYDWMHTNAVHYHPEWDQIVISVREFNELWIVDHSLSTAEAAGPAGDLLWRWGNPAVYQQGDPVDDRQLFRQHDGQ